MAAKIINPTQEGEAGLCRSYADYAVHKVQTGYSTLETYSPTTAMFVQDSFTKVQELTPQIVLETGEKLVADFDSVVDAADEILKAAMDRTAEFPILLEDLKEKFTADQIRSIFDSAGYSVESLPDFLPSKTITELDVKQRVEDIVSAVLSQPQILKGKASDIAEGFRTSLDCDSDGLVSVKDLAQITTTALEYCTSAVNLVLPSLPKGVVLAASFQDILGVFLENPTAKPIFQRLKSQWEANQTVSGAFKPLWAAVEVLKTYVTRYAQNLNQKFEPLSPYLMELIGGTSVIDLPIEIIQILQTATGLVQDKERDAVVRETRALFWALIDISFLLEVLKANKPSESKATSLPEGVELLNDTEALKSCNEWARSYGHLELA